MSSYTQWYLLDKYEGTDKPNLLDQYNTSMEKIDAAMKGLQNQILNGTELHALENRVASLEEITPIISGTYNVIDYGADPTGANYSNAAILAAVQAASGKGYVYFPSGTYKLNEPIDMHTYDHFGLIGDGAIITTDVSIDYLINAHRNIASYDHKKHFHNIMGLSFICDGLVNTALICSMHAHVSNCNFSGFKQYGIRPQTTANDDTSGNAWTVEDCTFYIDTSEIQGATGIKARTDCMFSNLRIFGCKTGIYCGSGTHFDNIYFWASYADFETIGIKCQAHSTSFLFDNVYFDTINIPCENATGMFNNCAFIYSGTGSVNNNNDFMVIRDTATSQYYPLAFFSGCIFNMINSFENDKFVPFSSKSRRINISGCMINATVPKYNQLSTINSNNDMGILRTPNVSGIGTWHKIATIHNEIAYSRPCSFKCTLGSVDNGRLTDIYFTWSTTDFRAIGQLSDYSMINVARFGIIKDTVNNTASLYISPKQTSLGSVQFYSGLTGINSGAFYVDYELTDLTDSDMTAIVDS